MLDRLHPQPGARRPPKRVGRGPGSGLHKTSGRGMKGQGKRSPGRETSLHFEGGQMPLVRRLPKRGFHNRNRKSFQIVNVGALVAFGDGATIDAETLANRGLVRRKGGAVKVLGQGDVPAKLTVRVQKVSETARRKIEEAGGSVELIQ